MQPILLSHAAAMCASCATYEGSAMAKLGMTIGGITVAAAESVWPGTENSWKRAAYVFHHVTPVRGARQSEDAPSVAMPRCAGRFGVTLRISTRSIAW